MTLRDSGRSVSRVALLDRCRTAGFPYGMSPGPAAVKQWHTPKVLQPHLGREEKRHYTFFGFIRLTGAPGFARGFSEA